MKTDEEIRFSHNGKYERSVPKLQKAWEQACRQRWRALNLALKAKLEAVEANITTFDEEFLAHLVLPNGKTYGQHVLPAVTKSLTDAKMPPLLPGGPISEE